MSLRRIKMLIRDGPPAGCGDVSLYDFTTQESYPMNQIEIAANTTFANVPDALRASGDGECFLRVMLVPPTPRIDWCP